jgi:hypothetical protein
MKFTETQLNDIAVYQEKRGVTRAAAIKACKRSWKKGEHPADIATRMVHMAAAAPALAPVENETVELATSAAEAREDAKAGGYAKGNRTRAANKKAKAEKAASEPKPEKHYTVGSLDTVKRGFLLEMITWAGRQQSVTVASLYRKFGGRKVSELRVRRYVSYCMSHGILRPVKGGK